MTIRTGDIAVSRAGRDQGKRFVVLGVCGERALLADGKNRRTEKPKLKNIKHLVADGAVSVQEADRLLEGKLTNAAVRRILAEEATGQTEAKGEFTCQKTM